MTYVLSARERKLLEELQIDHERFQVPGELPVGTGKVTLTRLTELGLLETGSGRWGSAGWRLSEDGWRCMYGMTYAEMRAGDGPYHPLKIWSWPLTPDPARQAAASNRRLTMLKPRLAELPPPLTPLD